MPVTTTEDRHYAMGVLAAKKAMSNGGQFSAMVNQAEEVLAKETPEAEVIRLREQLQSCEMSLKIYDDSRSSEYWERYAVQPGNE